MVFFGVSFGFKGWVFKLFNFWRILFFFGEGGIVKLVLWVLICYMFGLFFNCVLYFCILLVNVLSNVINLVELWSFFSCFGGLRCLYWFLFSFLVLLCVDWKFLFGVFVKFLLLVIFFVLVFLELSVFFFSKVCSFLLFFELSLKWK